MILAPTVLASPDPSSLMGLTFASLLVIGGIWLWFRARWPGDPVLKVDGDGVSYSRGNRTRTLRWDNIKGIEADYTLDRMRFIPRDGKPISMRLRMVTADGVDWAEVIDDYWEAPKDLSVC